jgi:hypothetical protein
MNGDVLQLDQLAQDAVLDHQPCQLQITVVNLPIWIGGGDELPCRFEGKSRAPQIGLDGSILARREIHSSNFLAGCITCASYDGHCGWDDLEYDDGPGRQAVGSPP